MLVRNRLLICTFVALMSGGFGFYIGGQMSMSIYSYKCQKQPWGLNTLCQAWEAPGAIWRGSTTGLWLGTVLGAFVAGVATKKG